MPPPTLKHKIEVSAVLKNDYQKIADFTPTVINKSVSTHKLLLDTKRSSVFHVGARNFLNKQIKIPIHI